MYKAESGSGVRAAQATQAQVAEFIRKNKIYPWSVSGIKGCGKSIVTTAITTHTA